MSVSRDTEVFINSCFVSWSLQRNRINRMYAYIERKWFSEGIGSWDGGALVNPEFNREDRLKAQERVAVWGSLLQNQKEPVFQMKPESCLLANCIYSLVTEIPFLFYVKYLCVLRSISDLLICFMAGLFLSSNQSQKGGHNMLQSYEASNSFLVLFTGFQ